MMDGLIRLIIIDDHWVVRQGIKASLKSDDGFLILGEASNGEDGLELIRTFKPQIALVDIQLPDMSGTEICRQVSMEMIPTAIIVLTAFLDWRLVKTCLQWGAKGYLLKEASELNLKEKLIAVANGEIVFDRRVVNMMANYVKNSEWEKLEVLNERELEILRLMAQGMNNREISEKMYLSQGTIKDNIHDIFQKLKARNRVEAILIAAKSGLL
jgi:NarL family two-component system response regulator LiaR